jgi:hypothetical protein
MSDITYLAQRNPNGIVAGEGDIIIVREAPTFSPGQQVRFNGGIARSSRTTATPSRSLSRRRVSKPELAITFTCRLRAPWLTREILCWRS